MYCLSPQLLLPMERKCALPFSVIDVSVRLHDTYVLLYEHLLLKSVGSYTAITTSLCKMRHVGSIHMTSIIHFPTTTQPPPFTFECHRPLLVNGRIRQ
ncbi:hypothetical protein, unlikely [Trypanosoma brucei gambiense DAL972]|uniref:Uncharacterized protein n=1 Tax=Trypanosoma brucei gambiense (strain MHOM/CI/86/DAL972) TaxID=679716 RepID=C9ZIK7_TRYB9|nr:hypothetical protein, unlikely [Trypanosoma brucei gambiense DAL972]CBH08999.1 hypothetical protein, unlikely [Trypanosoma brucei gambiense DAL972]|eukprot:XP_011771440.1 hypothetical protein, unlikely [Trypanosoma brucei gambiense DAL972]